MEKIEPQGSISDSEQQFLQPISKFFPPNEIITKNYAPDQKPIVKLMKLQKHESGTCSELKNKYKGIFDSDDTLGYQHSYSLSNDVVYLKFNNQNYFKCKIKNHTYKFLAGLFIPYEKITSPEVKMSKNIYKTLPDIQYIEYKNNIQDSFQKNSKITNSKTLRFSSNYQSGNLFIAMKKKQYQYDLILQNDINSKGNIQWFNFAVEFGQIGTYKFNILNFTKSYSQYQDGMKILFYSFKDQENGVHDGWARGCENIRYEKNHVRREDSDFKHYNCLKFEYTCIYPQDKVIFSYFYPYTSLDLEKFMKRILYRKLSVYMKMQKIKVCQTLSGLPVYAISIKHKKSQKSETQLMTPNFKNTNTPLPKPNKTIVFMARQHSGQSQGSFVVEGIIEILMQNGEIDYLKKNIDFVIFPMVNVDGVFYGNYRTNLSGTDLNRVWRNPSKQLHPQVYYIKKYLQIINKSSPIALIIDLHGHSKSLNSFFYGNPSKKDIISGSIEDSRLFPYVCSKKMKQISFLQSTFFVSEDKKNSARVVLAEHFPKAHVYTLQHSFQGWKKENSDTIIQYTPQTLRKIGRQLVLTYLQYDKLCEKNPQIKQKWTKQISQLKQRLGGKDNNSDAGQSDSEAEFELINVDPPLQKLNTLDTNIPQKSLFNSSSDLVTMLKKENKENNFIQRNVIIRTHLQDRSYNKYNRKMINLDTSQPIRPKRQSKQKKANTTSASSGFLSIVKIRTPNQVDEMIKINSVNVRPDDRQKEQYMINKESIIQKLKRKKMKIQEAVISSAGMKAFLKTMGIPLEKKYY